MSGHATAWPLESAQKRGLEPGQEEGSRAKGDARESQGVSELHPGRPGGWPVVQPCHTPSLSHNQRGEIWRPSSPWDPRPLYPIGGKFLAYQNEMGLSQPAGLPPECCFQVPETSFLSLVFCLGLWLLFFLIYPEGSGPEEWTRLWQN